MENSRIVFTFFYKSLNIGGAQMLFYRLAKRLIMDGKQVRIIESGQKNSFISSQLIKSGFSPDIKNIPEGEKYQTKADELFILSLSYIFDINKHFDFNPQTRFVFWELHPKSMVTKTLFGRIYLSNFINKFIKSLALRVESDFRKRIREFVISAHKANSLYFMCSKNYNFNNKLFNFNIEPQYIPIPVYVGENESTEQKVEEDKKEHLNIGWISRLSHDKVNILEILVKDILDYNLKNDTSLTIRVVGEGVAFKRLEKYKKILGENLVFYGKLEEKELKNFMSHVDIGFSIGTSALEFAANQIPTVVTPGVTDNNTFKNVLNKYSYLHELGGYDLAVDKRHKNTNELHDFNTIVKLFQQNSQELSKKDSAYVRENHEFDVVFEKFINNAASSSFTYETMKKTGYFKRDILHKTLKGIKRGLRLMSDLSKKNKH